MDVVSVADVPTEERFSYYREVSSKLWMPLEARCEPDLVSGFRAQGAFSGLGPVQALLLTTTQFSVRRTPKLIRQFDPEMFFLNCPVRGRVIGEQDGRSADLRVGDLLLRDSSRPYSTRFVPEDDRGSQTLLLQFPRSMLPLPERDLRDLTAVRLPGDQGIGALSSQFLLQLARRMDEFSPADTARLSTLTLDVLTATLASALETENAIPPHTRHRALMAQIHAFIQTNLADPHLTLDAIAAAHHISVSYLHRLFQTGDTTVSAWIRNQRLARARHDLSDPALHHLPIHQIATRWGFTDHATFTRAFRTTYDIPPRDYRHRALKTSE